MDGDMTESENESINKCVKKKKKTKRKSGTFRDTCRGCRRPLEKESVTCTRSAFMWGTVWETAERPITHYWSVTWCCRNFKWRQISTSYSDLLRKVFAKRILLWRLQFCHSLRNLHEFLLMNKFSPGRNVSIIITLNLCTMSYSLFTT